MLTKKVKYGLKAMVHLAGTSPGRSDARYGYRRVERKSPRSFLIRFWASCAMPVSSIRKKERAAAIP